ncbi:MAG: M1 family metallopeptidase [Saprospiraceae bacterium]|nr:M1 family metallopeptidase [Saprospiraceae bacterium]
MKSLIFKNIWHLAILLLVSCASKKEITYTAPDDGLLQEELLDTLVITSGANVIDSLPKEFRATKTMEYDILHTKLDLRFDWAKRHVHGVADLTIKPYFKPINSVILDAVGFDIHSVSNATDGKAYIYQYDGVSLNVDLGKEIKSSEKIQVRIHYTAKPDENIASGSDAITSDKGLFFIDPDDTDPDLPTQIWTQGETENNSRWFPTFDKPTERFSQEIILTVDKKFSTLSNGKKISSKLNTDGTRSDHWKQDREHTPYLAMIAVGEFDEETDTWNSIPLHYYVDKGFGRHAKKIFNHTPEMLSFFTEKLKYPYPWDKYSQVVVREFVSGAMENTGAVVFGDFVQKTERELIDNDNDYIVAHEMMHHWFGNLVTCEDWSNLTLNEGFANYAEYLWFEHKYGKNRAEHHRMNEMNGYYSQVMSGSAHPLVDYYYDDKEKMFDAHSYNKGGLVLHMLRNYLGDDVFFASLNYYLKKNENSAVEVDELRMAFEDISGQDLNWFFDQWFLGTGHPYLDVKYTYNDENKVLLVEVDQSGTPKGFHQNFRLPVDIAIYYPDGSVQFHPVVINEKKQRILIEDLKMKPATYVFDGKNVLLAMINENKTNEQYKAQFRFSPNYMDKMVAFSNTSDGNYDLLVQGMNEKHHTLRSLAINAIPDSLLFQYLPMLQEKTLSDPHSEVRHDALMRLAGSEDFDPGALCKLILDTEKSYPVIGLALELLHSVQPEKVGPYIEKLKNEDADQLAGTLVSILTEDSPENSEYISRKAKNINLYQLFDFYERLQEYFQGKSMKTLTDASEYLTEIASFKNGNMYRKYIAMVTLNKIAEDLSSRYETSANEDERKTLVNIIDKINFIVKNETNPVLKEKYEGMEK